ncbi:MAG: YigZ family protein [Holophagaceae bacterium]|nr:YigZ family protein [Holophagaceae bacterium]
MERLKDFVSFKFREKASVFLTELHWAPNGDARSLLLAAARKRDYDATHHCSAWREGVPVSVFGSDDDGEPSGTAGAPMLKVLEGHDITDTLAICVRWYGGTKLGTGGLVRAYTEGVQGAVAEGQRLGLFEEVRETVRGIIEVPIEMAHTPFAIMNWFKNAEILDQEFEGDAFRLSFRLPTDERQELEDAWRERSRGGHVDWKG